MIKEAIGTGATADEAYQAALKVLNAPEGVVVKQDVISQAKQKFLGIFGGAPCEVRAYYEIEDDKFADIKAYINNILVNLGITGAVIDVKVENDEDVRINIGCEEDYGSVIGRRGETLDAIQYLTRLVLNRQTDEYKHISINVGNYREKREATLRALASKNAAKVRKYGRNVVLEPMNPYERRIIHTAVQEIEGVTSHSVGSDDDRKVVITLEEGVKPTNGSSYNNNRGRSGYNNNNNGGKGGYNKGGYNKGGYNNNHSRSNYSRPASEPVSQTPTREPRSDTAGTLYGKIDINK